MFNSRLKTHHSAMAEGAKYLKGPGVLMDVLEQKNSTNRQPATIYIHVPFCSKICSFCNMRRSLQEPHSNYGDWIVEEIRNYGSYTSVKEMVFDAVYFGGGTPTTLDKEDLRKIIRALKECFRFTENAEFTIETTVSELTEDKIAMFWEEGVNRFSVGVQTFHDEGRRQMNRIGSGRQAFEKLRYLKNAGFATVSMDLIYNYPNQTVGDLMEDLKKITSLELGGFSMYSLINMKETKIDEAQGLKNDEEMFFRIAETMERSGYRFLELTKMVRDDTYKYIMNRHYGADTLPLGAGAGGSICGLAMMNPIDLREYQTSVAEFGNRKGMQMHPAYKDSVIFKGDLQRGYLPRNTALYKDYEAYQAILSKLLAEHYVVKEGEEYRLTHKGIFWGNTISRELAAMTQ
ncbi:coproporphyrinogen III oxidase [Anaerocolumna cellulosilytica]|uniref:Heme chaperone HemW n=1 Tax=Anaerocolumna cellulosilytica TaxID=433286 RepID=A0A6S6R0D7_9FIRM|nr:coproporphyrinogen-III oxidase family protein [Anaerocolumna cellulosilytica]MBB5196897.1 oxygen-independent coproporphyrinogen-3 oxidase [Anaerocolumna cellulosilytica]BCJ92701.1 coproporphyrinogen III oxidase [Anaerocolumna cellulosilytica]